MAEPTFRLPAHTTRAPDVTVVIPCKGDPDVLVRLLSDLHAQKIDRRYEVVVVDAWSDDAVKTATAAHGAVVARDGTGNLPGAARNVGAAAARGRILAFIDADCRPDPGWLQAAVDTLDAGAKIAAGPVADLHPLHPVARADNLLQFADLPRGRPAGPMHMAPSCNLAIRAEDFRQLGGFCHRAGLSTGEDVDFCERAVAMWPAGLQFAPLMAVRHGGRRTIPELIRHHRTFGYSRGRLRLLLTERQARLGQLRVLAPAVVLRRLSYVFSRVARLSPAKLPMTIVICPLLMIGTFAWTAGFRCGLIDSAPDDTRATSPSGSTVE